MNAVDLQFLRENYRPQSPKTSTVLFQLFKAYREDPEMNEKLKQFVRESNKQMTPEQLVQTFPRETLEAAVRILQANGTAPQTTEKPEASK
jgi:hypothetical protein